MKITDLWKNFSAVVKQRVLHPVKAEGKDAFGSDVLRSFEHKFPSADQENPFAVRGNLVRSDRGYEYLLSVNITNARHPYDAESLVGHIGDESKNPALLPALNILRDELPRLATGEMRKLGITKRSLAAHDGLACMDNTIGTQFLLRFNPSKDSWDLPKNFKRVAEKKVVQLFDAIAQRVDAMRPVIQQSLDANKHLQPPPNPVAASLYLGELFAGRTKALMGSPHVVPVAVDEAHVADLVAVAGQQGNKVPVIATRDEQGILKFARYINLNH